MKAEEPDMKPGFLREIYEADPAPTPPEGGWARIEEALYATGKQPAWLFWLPAVLLVTVGSYWGMRPLPASTAKVNVQNPIALRAEQATESATNTRSTSSRLAKTQPDLGSSITASTKEVAPSTRASTDNNIADLDASASAVRNQQKVATLPTAKETETETHSFSVPPREAKRGANFQEGASVAELRPALSLKQKPSLNRAALLASTDAQTMSETTPSAVARPSRARPRVGGAYKGANVVLAEQTPNTKNRNASTNETGRETTTSDDSPNALASSTDNDKLEPLATPITAGAQNGYTAPTGMDGNVESAASAGTNKAMGDSTSTLVKLPLPKADSVAATKPAIVVPTKPKSKSLTYEVGAHLLLRQRNAAIEGRADYTRLAWSSPQPRVLPGLELFASIGYKQTKTFSIGTALGIAGWQEKFGMDVTQLAAEPHMTELPNQTYVMEIPYGVTQSQVYQWNVVQTHAELWVRYSPKTMPLVLQAAPTLDMLKPFGGNSQTPKETMYRPGLAVTMRYMPGHVFYEAGIRQTFGPSIKVPNYFHFNYQFVSVGVGYSW